MSGASGLRFPLSFSSLTFIILFSPFIIFVSAFSCHGCNLRLVLGFEGGLGLVEVVEVDSGDGGGGHRDLLRGVEALVRGLEHIFVSGGGEVHVTDMGPNVHRKL